MPGDCGPPHLQSLPSSEAVEEPEGFDLGVYAFLLSPLSYFKEVVRFTPNISAKAFFADSVILKIRLSLMGPDLLKIYKFKFIYILIVSSYKIQKLLNSANSLENQTHVLI